MDGVLYFFLTRQVAAALRVFCTFTKNQQGVEECKKKKASYFSVGERNALLQCSSAIPDCTLLFSVISHNK